MALRPRRRRSLSLRTRLTAIVIGSSTALVAILVTAVQLLLAHTATSDALHVLRARATAAASTVKVVRGHAAALEGPSDSLDQNIWIFDADGRRIDGAVPPEPLRSNVAAIASRGREATLVVDGVRLYSKPVINPVSSSRLASVVVSTDLSPYESSERRSLLLSIALGGLVILAAGGATWASVGASLRQVHRMVRRAEDWQEHDLTQRFGLGEPVDELTELGQTLDHMLDRITTALQTERRLTDEVAHELRTPLTVIRTEAQLALRPGGSNSDKDQALHAISASTERMEQAIRTMLLVARRSHQGESESCLVSEVLNAVQQHTPTTAGVTLEFQPVSDELHVAAPLDVVVAALTPVVDNAMRHARSTIRLSATAQDDRVLVSIHDDGPGVDEADREQIFQPGMSTREGGAGLGLSLSRRLAHSMGGEIYASGEAAGLFVLSLPAR